MSFFQGVSPIQYEGPGSTNPLAFRWYNPDEVVAGKSMREHLRFAVAYWHTFCGDGSDPFGDGSILHAWDAADDPVERAQDKLEAAFEFCTKIGVDHYCFHDVDIVDEGESIDETRRRLDRIVPLLKEKQGETGVKLLWNTSNMFGHRRFTCGAATNPDARVFAFAATKVKKMLDVALELGAENYVFWGGREGYETLLNTDMKREQDHLAVFLRMAVDYAKTIGFKGQFLIEPKPKEPTKHQYDFDSATVIGFLKNYGLAENFKINVEANHATLAGHDFEHDLTVAAMNGMLGSVDANRGDLLIGWDTDQFPADVYDATKAMLAILQAGGLAPGGLNFDAHVRRSSLDPVDLVHAHVGAMDTFAYGLRTAARILEDGVLSSFVRDRYASYDKGIGAKIEAGTVGFDELEAFTLENGDPEPVSGRQEHLENILNRYILGAGVQ